MSYGATDLSVGVCHAVLLSVEGCQTVLLTRTFNGISRCY